MGRKSKKSTLTYGLPTSKIVGYKKEKINDYKYVTYKIIEEDDGFGNKTTRRLKEVYIDGDNYGISGTYDKDWIKKKAEEFRQSLIEKATKAERKLYNSLVDADLGDIFEFQKPIFMDKQVCSKSFYIVDFLFPDKKLVVEIDGKYHNDKFVNIDDTLRELHLKDAGYNIIRFTNQQVFDDVNCKNIINKILNYEK